MVATTQTHEVLEAIEEVLGPQGHLIFNKLLLKLAANAESADTAQTIAVAIEKLVLKKLLGLLQLRRVTRAKTLIYPQQSLIVIRSGILGQGVKQ